MKLFTTVLIFFFVLQAQSIDTYHDYYYLSEQNDTIYILDDNISYSVETSHNDNSENNIFQVLEQNKIALNLLFGSEQKLEEETCIRYLDEQNYWQLDSVLYSIESRLNENDFLNKTMRNDISKVKLALKEQISSISCHQNSSILYQLKNIIGGAIGRKKRNSYFNRIKLLFENEWDCSAIIPDFWWSVITADYQNKNYTLEKAVEAVLDINKNLESLRSNIEEIYEKLLEDNRKSNKLKLSLVRTLSNPQTRKLLSGLVCGSSSLAKCDFYRSVLCDSFTYHLIKELTKKIEGNFFLLMKPESIITVLQLQKKLNDISIELSNLEVDPRYFLRSSKEMLDYYFGIIDNAIGKKSISAWKQASEREAQNQFEQILLESENFAGCTSDKILNSGVPHVKIVKDTVDVQLKQITNKDVETKEDIKFDFEDVQIWTENLNQTFQDFSEFNVIVLNYKSWHETLLAINGMDEFYEANDNGSSITQKTQSNLTLIGRGGIVTMHARTQNQQDKSISVYYKMKFENDSVFDENKDVLAKRCISCRFLEGKTRTWATYGCYAVEVDQDSVTCFCNHTTNFAAFMSPYKANFSATDSQKQLLNVLEYIGSALSVVFLFLSFVIFCMVRHTIRHDRLKAHINLVVALWFVHLIQLGAEAAVSNNIMCITVAITTHYFLLVAFMWMLIEGIFLYIYVIQVFALAKVESRMWMYVTGWGLPFMIVFVCAVYGLLNDVYLDKDVKQKYTCPEGQLLYPAEENKTDVNYSSCWLSTSSGMIWSFIAPALCVIAINLVILCMVVEVLVKISTKNKKMSKSQIFNRSRKNYLPDKSTSKSVTKSEQSEETGLAHDSLHGIEVTHSINSFTGNANSSNKSAIHRTSARTEKCAKDSKILNDVKAAVKGSIVLLPILGIPWTIGILAYKSFILRVIFVVFNSIQGVAIFFVYCVYNEEVVRALRRRFERYRINHFNNSRQRMSSESSLRFMSRHKKRIQSSTMTTAAN